MVMKYLFDSNIVSEPSKSEPNKKVLELILKNQFDAGISVISYFEMMHGILILPEGKRKERLLSFLTKTIEPFYNFIPYDFIAAKTNAQILAKLESVGNPIPFADSQIASIALSKNLILVTRNVKDFMPIQKYFPLKIENWFE